MRIDAYSTSPVAYTPSRVTNASRIATGRDELVGGSVPGGVEFSRANQPAASTLSVHARAEDRNAAATSIAVGRLIDVDA